LSGWAFSISNVNEPSDLYKTEIILFNETQNFVFESIPQWREDIVKAYGGFLIRDTGFDVLINRNMIPFGRFCVGILLTNMENNNQYFIMTNYLVQNRVFKIDLLQTDYSYCESIYEKFNEY